MKIYIISDTHFGHDKMVELCGRPDNHSNLILSNLSVIPSGAVLIHLGDFCIGDDDYWHTQFAFMTTHVRRKILVKGNHDHKSNNWYLSKGWDFVCDEFKSRYFGKDCLFTHKPTENAVHYNIHGHLHNTGHHEQGKSDNHILFAIENTNYKAVNLEKLLK